VSLVEDAGVAAGLFATTNVDDLLVLVALFADRATRTSSIVLGQIAGVAALTAASLVLARGAVALPDRVVALLGLVPLALGVRRLARRRRGHSDGDDDELSGHRHAGMGALAVAALTVANGADNVAAYVPAFASLARTGVVLAVFASLTAAWLAAARALVAHPRVGPPLARIGTAALPWVLIALGAAILVREC
jgi:cadmium resistance protein CadD (predicted permease)